MQRRRLESVTLGNKKQKTFEGEGSEEEPVVGSKVIHALSGQFF